MNLLAVAALFVVLAVFVGLRESELLELRRSDVDESSGLISVTRKIDKDGIGVPTIPGSKIEVRRSLDYDTHGDRPNTSWAIYYIG